MFSGKKIVIAGGSGFIGGAMAARWSEANEVIILGRQQRGETDNAYGGGTETKAQHLTWDARTQGSWAAALKGADILINLSGKSVNCRYTRKNKQSIRGSRVMATEALGEALRHCTVPPRLWINASSATIYRHAEDRAQDERTGEMHDDFSVQVCKAWEAAFYGQQTPYTRKVALRMAIVLGHGGVLVPFRRLVQAGLGGPQGSGRQMFSWIHIDDLCRIVEWLEARPEKEGTYNASAPGPLPNHQLMQTLRQTLGIPGGIPSPAWMLKIGAWLIGTETEFLLKSRWVIPGRLLAEGFGFQYPTLAQALGNLLLKEPAPDSYAPANP